MGTAWFAVLCLLICVFQASVLVTAEEPTCVPGFESDMLIFKVFRRHLKQSTRLGKVGFSDCTDRTRFVFSSDDTHFMVQTDGILKVNRPVNIHHLRDFFIHCWDSRGRKMSVRVRVLYHEHSHGNIHQNAELHNHQQHLTEVESANNTESATDPQALTWHFPVSSEGQRRRKRDWALPSIQVVENDRGPYPLKVVQVRSDEGKKKIYYSITGPGADEPPIGLFVMDRDTGNLYLTQSLDREERDKYTFQVHAVYQDGSGNAEEPMEIVVTAVVQNDSKPVFTQVTFQGEVAEASPLGFEVIQVVATDLDQPNTDNSDIRYGIISQEPTLPSDSLFVINPVTGVIRVNSRGLDRQKYPNYTLVVQAADMLGEGLTGEAKVILTVTDRNDNAPAFTQHSYEATVAENEVDAQVITMSVTDGDEPHSLAWNAKFTIVDGDPGGLFSVTTGSDKHEGIISTAKGLDFEKSSKHILLVAVENEVPFATLLPTATATVVVNVQDINEAPDPIQKHVSKQEDHAVDSDVQ